MNRMLLAPFVGFAMALCAQADAASPWGIEANDAANVLLTPVEVNPHGSFQTPSGPQPQTFLTLTPQNITASTSGDIGKPGFPVIVHQSGQADASGFVDATSGRPMLHGAVDAMAPNVATCVSGGSCTGASADASLKETWLDPITVNGTANTEVQLMITDHFSGSLSLTGTNPNSGGLEGYSQFNLNNGPLGGVTCATHCGGGNFDDRYTQQTPGSWDFTNSFVVSTLAGNVVTFEEQLLLQAIAGTEPQEGPSSSAVDALNTSFVTIQVLTPGASISSASGLSYLPANGAPEPATLALLGIGLAGLGFSRRHKLS